MINVKLDSDPTVKLSQLCSLTKSIDDTITLLDEQNSFLKDAILRCESILKQSAKQVKVLEESIQ